MKMDRNINPDGRGKYALLNLRTNQVQWGLVGEEDEFFVIKLKDKYARDALLAYARAAYADDIDWSMEVADLAERAGAQSPFCKAPD